ncbi:hypothetical protein [Nocardiopsis ansamitocini]|uniref:Uncharacterized protein n=1 Tax=Nocardiopsis ansamitocini TaxID=1670832 RepID=A0A9W6P5T9_9ACTN|nr:hypothetical protein [Nocardiopsis ansamitocini]GLU47587.1 hypothetical protein Nans01_19380 [Nocardiopsis ansamitocini]
MDTLDSVTAALARVRWDFPAWTITHTPDTDPQRMWNAHRRAPLTRAEHSSGRKRDLHAPTLDALLTQLGAEQRALDDHQGHRDHADSSDRPDR